MLAVVLVLILIPALILSKLISVGTYCIQALCQLAGLPQELSPNYTPFLFSTTTSQVHLVDSCV